VQHSTENKHFYANARFQQTVVVQQVSEK